MATVHIDNETMLEMLMDRVKHWTDDDDTLELYSQYYERMVYGGAFDGCDFDIMQIVDNDYVNWLAVVSDDDLDGFFDESIDITDRIEASCNGWYLVNQS